MKRMYIMLVGLGCLILMSGCVKVERMCGYSKFYCDPYYNNGACGPRITYRCDFVCDACASNEPACQACWACINTDGCLDYSKYSKYQNRTCYAHPPKYQ